MRLSLCLLAAICLLAASVTAVFAVPQQRQMLQLGDDFEGYGDEYFVPLYVDLDNDGMITDADWQTWGGAPPTPTDDKFAKVTALGDGNHVAWLKDNQQTGNAQIYSNFFAPLANPPTERNYGRYQVTMDVMPIDGTFKIDLTTGGTFTTGGNWIVGVGFGGDDNTFFPEQSPARTSSCRPARAVPAGSTG